MGTDYFCETASRVTSQNKYYLQDPLWDGQGSGRFSSCCDGGRKPWFCKELPIEIRVVVGTNENVLLETIELYIQ